MNGVGAEREGEADSALSREPDAGLNPRTPGSSLEQRADTKPIESHRSPYMT